MNKKGQILCTALFFMDLVFLEINSLNNLIIQFLKHFKTFGYPMLTRQNLIPKSCLPYAMLIDAQSFT